MTAMRRTLIAASLGAALLATAVPSVTLGAGPCRARNVDEGTSGSLKALAAAAHDGDRLRVRGMCRGEVVVSADIIIRGLGDQPTVTGRGERRALRIAAGAEVTIRDLIIRDGLAPDAAVRGGGGIRNAGDLTVIASVVRDNRAGPGGLGGGILNVGDLVVFDSVIRQNRAFRGGGIDSRAIAGGDATPTISIGGTRIVRDRAGTGGGIHNMGAAFIEFSEIDRNRAVAGGGIANVQTGVLDVENSHIRDNTATSQGGGIANFDGGVVTVGGGTTFSGNSPTDCFGTAAC
jgi:hypothetical protein